MSMSEISLKRFAVEQGPPLVDPTRVHPHRDLRDDRPRVAGGASEARVDAHAAALLLGGEERPHPIQIDPELLGHGSEV